MESVVAARVNSSLERMRRSIGGIESRFEEIGNATKESGRRMDAWANSVIATDREHQSLYITGLSELEETLVRSQEHQKLAKKAIEANEHEAEHYRQESRGLQNEIDDLAKAREVIPREKEVLKHSLQAEERRYMERKGHVTQAKSRLGTKVEALQSEITRLQRALGLQLEVNEDRTIRFRFRYIDADNPTAEYIVTVTKSDTRFKAVECEPMVTEFEWLNNKLMNDDKLVSFLREIRGAFVRSANVRGVRAPNLDIDIELPLTIQDCMSRVVQVWSEVRDVRRTEQNKEVTYSGPISRLPELLKAPLRMASGLRGFEESILGAEE